MKLFTGLIRLEFTTFLIEDEIWVFASSGLIFLFPWTNFWQVKVPPFSSNSIIRFKNASTKRSYKRMSTKRRKVRSFYALLRFLCVEQLYSELLEIRIYMDEWMNNFGFFRDYRMHANSLYAFISCEQSLHAASRISVGSCLVASNTYRGIPPRI
jgi:hypothetical protein